MNFDDLGYDFPLYDAPVETASTDPSGDCSVCGEHVEMRFDGGCYECLRAGKINRVVGTEFGMVRRQDALAGRTHGVPIGLLEDLDGYEIEPHPVDPDFPEEQWASVLVEESDLVELLRTPIYHSWQGEHWLLCCGRPTVFVGEATMDLLASDPRGLPAATLLTTVFSRTGEDVETLAERLRAPGVSTYAFRCRDCGVLHAYWDRT